jgi:diaminopimelate epimerase
MSAESLKALRGMPFAKMTGSGNDFVFFDARVADAALLTQPEAIRAICNRFNGIGADGVVILEPNAHGANAKIHYFNSDGTTADLCGNATLCSTALAVQLQIGVADGLTLWTDAGLIASRLAHGTPEIDLAPVSLVESAIDIKLEPGERQIGYALAGIPHLVVLVDDVDHIDLPRRGAFLRSHVGVGEAGANVNFVMTRGDGTWRYRTFERGVEGETLACGTGSIATAILLITWGLAASPVTIWTSSNRPLIVRMRHSEDGTKTFSPSLKGEGRVVYRGYIEEI